MARFSGRMQSCTKSTECEPLQPSETSKNLCRMSHYPPGIGHGARHPGVSCGEHQLGLPCPELLWRRTGNHV